MLLAAESLNIGSCLISGVDRLAAKEEGRFGFDNGFFSGVWLQKNENPKAAPRKENSINFVR
jgi:nitroreductase